MDFGSCEEHNRNLEAYCLVCNMYSLLTLTFSRLVCPTCVMFAAHKGHNVTEPDVAVRNLRDSFDQNIKSGTITPLISLF